MIYILRSDGAYVQFQGMSEANITSMLQAQSLTCTFIEVATFNAATQNTHRIQ